MAKSIYTYYKERLIEISGSNKCLYLKSIVRKGAYDMGRIFEGREDKLAEFNEFIFTQNRFPLTLISQREKKDLLIKTLNPDLKDLSDGFLDSLRSLEMTDYGKEEL